MSSIAAALAATEEEQVSPNYPPRVYNRTAVLQGTAETPIHQQPTISPCVYNNSTAVLQQKKSENAETRTFN